MLWLQAAQWLSGSPGISTPVNQPLALYSVWIALWNNCVVGCSQLCCDPVCVDSEGGVCLLSFSTLLSYDGKKVLLLLCKLTMTKVEVKLNSHQSCQRLHHFIGTKEMSPQLISQTSKLSRYKTSFSHHEALIQPGSGFLYLLTGNDKGILLKTCDNLFIITTEKRYITISLSITHIFVWCYRFFNAIYRLHT